jgi:hypothetical protein
LGQSQFFQEEVGVKVLALLGGEGQVVHHIGRGQRGQRGPFGKVGGEGGGGVLARIALVERRAWRGA